MKYGLRALVPLLAFSGAVVAAGLPAHQHGRASLSVAIEGPLLVVELSGPLDNFTGFEHAPRNAAERRKLAEALALLRKPSSVLSLPEAAACRPDEAEVGDPFAAHEGHDHGGGHEDSAHSELHASYRFDCADPAALGHLEVALFAAFPRLARLQATVVGPAGQSAVELSRKRTRLEL